MQRSGATEAAVNWRQVALFVALTYALAYLLDLLLYGTVGYGQNLGAGLLLQVQMLIPASVAIALQLFVFKDSRIRNLQDRSRFFFYFYLAYAGIYAALAVSTVLITDSSYQTIASIMAQALNVGGLIFLAVLRLVSGKDAFERAGLKGGKFKYFLLFGLLLVAIYGSMSLLNYSMGLGQRVDVQMFLREASGGQPTGMEEAPDLVVLLVTGVQSVLLGPLLALLLAFGEEYGWRGYLQGELTKLGNVRGIVLVGLIWGLWHAPVILMGHNYPGYPLLGVLLMTLYTLALSFFFGYAVLKSGSIWLAAFLHGLNNQVLSFLNLMVVRVEDPVYSFGVGIYGLAIWGLVVAGILILGRKTWTGPSVQTDYPEGGK